MSFTDNSIYTFRNFVDLNEHESAEVLSGRNDACVRAWMTSTEPISTDEHAQFMCRLKGNDRSLYVRIDRAGCFVGVYSLNEITNSVGQGGFWVTPFARERLMALNVVFQGMDYMFRVCGINTIYGFQNAKNHSAIRLNALLGLRTNTNDLSNSPDMIRIEMSRQHWYQKIRQDIKLITLMERVEKLNGTN